MALFCHSRDLDGHSRQSPKLPTLNRNQLLTHSLPILPSFGHNDAQKCHEQNSSMTFEGIARLLSFSRHSSQNGKK